MYESGQYSYSNSNVSFSIPRFTKPAIFLLGTVKTNTCFKEWSGFYFGSQSRPVAVIGQNFVKKFDNTYNVTKSKKQLRAAFVLSQPL